jgi:dTDP-4-amino-4,6-dideoxygalactose transaminase
LKLKEINLSHKEVFEQLRAKGIGVNLHYIPVHTQPYYKELSFVAGQFIESEKYYTDAISIPLFHTMTEVQQNKVVAALTEILI